MSNRIEEREYLTKLDHDRDRCGYESEINANATNANTLIKCDDEC